MTEKNSSNFCDCNTCCKQIPKSTAMTHEGQDYQLHFCGVACFNKWQLKEIEDKKSDK